MHSWEVWSLCFSKWDLEKEHKNVWLTSENILFFLPKDYSWVHPAAIEPQCAA